MSHSKSLIDRCVDWLCKDPKAVQEKDKITIDYLLEKWEAEGDLTYYDCEKLRAILNRLEGE